MGSKTEPLRLNTAATLIDVDGNHTRLANQMGSITVISFWATFCKPCLEELPYLEKLAEAYKHSRDIKILEISLDPMKDAPQRAKAMARKLGLSSVRVLTDVDRQLSLQLSNGDPSHLPPIPLLVVLGPDGVVHYQERGFNIGKEKQFVEDHRRVIEEAARGLQRAGSPAATR